MMRSLIVDDEADARARLMRLLVGYGMNRSPPDPRTRSPKHLLTQAIAYPSIWPLEPLLWPRSQDEDKANAGRAQSRSVAGEWNAVAPLCRPLTFHTASLCLIANTLTSISRRSRQTLSASVERTATDAVSCPHLQPVISGISSPYRAMNAR